MSTVSKWFRHNKLSVNFNKTKYMLFGSNNKKLDNVNRPLIIGNERVDRVTTYKYLSIKLDQTLNFAAHIEYIRSKTIGKIRLLGKIAPILDQNTSLYLYRSLVLPIWLCWLCLGLSITTGLTHTTETPEHGPKNILNVPRLTPTEQIHTQLKQDMLGTRRQKHTASFMYEVHYDLAPPQFKEMFTKLSQIHDRQTRINEFWIIIYQEWI